MYQNGELNYSTEHRTRLISFVGNGIAFPALRNLVLLYLYLQQYNK